MIIDNINWDEIQKKYDSEKISERKICMLYGISSSLIHRAKKKGLFKTRDKSELLKIIIESAKKRKLSQETKDKISKSRKEYLKNNPDKVPYLLNHSSNESYPEKYFRELFINENIKVEKKIRVGLYELDFSIPNKKIDIEIDGSQHYLDKKIIESDIRRTKFLEENGWDVIRIDWSSYQKMSFEEKSRYILDIKNYINNLLNKKPTTKNFLVKNECECSELKSNKKRYVKKSNCVKCGNICTNNRCDRCYRLESRKVERPSYEQLLEEISQLGYCGTGRKYGVSDNAIRKWIKRYETK